MPHTARLENRLNSDNNEYYPNKSAQLCPESVGGFVARRGHQAPTACSDGRTGLFYKVGCREAGCREDSAIVDVRELADVYLRVKDPLPLGQSPAFPGSLATGNKNMLRLSTSA